MLGSHHEKFYIPPMELPLTKSKKRKHRVHINIDSLSNLEKFGKKFGHTYPVGVRLRPNILAGGNLKISTGHEKSKFGIPVEQLDKILLIVVEKYNIKYRPAYSYRQRN